ncbi:hypothetical protein OJ998_03875 [Solirubrobacter taibaiensis]|nr:hypothetical protein [Solirubrobacter taibaiensis]
MRKLLVLIGLLFVLPAAPASAQTPVGCTANRLDVAATWSPAKGRLGLASTFSVSVAQTGAGACDVSGVTIRVALPGVDGQPAATSTVVAAGANYPGGMPSTTVATLPWVVALNPGVTVATARVDVVGTLRDTPVGSALTFSKMQGVPIAAPKLGFTVVAEPATGTAPLDVTYRFALTNQGEPADPLTSVALAHPYCTPVYGSGDTDGDAAIDAAETWRYACTHRFATPGDYTSTSNATAISTSDDRPVSATAVNTLVRAIAGDPLGALTLMTVASPASGFAPLGVTYTYTVRNTGTGAVRDVTVTDGGCSPVTSTGGATPLGAGQTRTFTCSRLFDTVGTFSASALASGIDEFTLRGVDSGPITTGVTVDAPTATPVPTASPDPGATLLPGPTPTPTATPTPTTKSTRVSFTAAGRFARPCRGRVALTLKAGTKTITRKTAKPDRSCRYRVRFDVARSRLGKATRVTVTARLGRTTNTQRFSVPR